MSQIFSLKEDSSKFRLLFVITTFLICTVNVFLLTVNPELLVNKNRHLSVNEEVGKNEQSLELKVSGITLTTAALKVEKVSVTCSDSFDSGDDYIDNINTQIKKYSIKKYSLISNSELVISKTLHLSPLITRLQI